MTTKVQTFYAKIAARYGVDPNDESAVKEFFDTGSDALPIEERMKIINELFGYNGKVKSDLNES